MSGRMLNSKSGSLVVESTGGALMGFLRGWTVRRQSLAPAGTEPGQERGRSRAFSVRTLMVFVAACGGLIAAAKVTYDSFYPVNGWARQVRKGTVAERRIAAEMLGRIGPSDVESAIPALGDAISDEDEQVAISSALSLSMLANTAQANKEREQAQAAIASLLAASADSRLAVRQVAFWGLHLAEPNPGMLGAKLNSTLTQRLLGAPSDPDAGIRTTAAKSFATIGMHSTKPPPKQLRAMLAGDPLPEARAAAALSLGQFQSGHDATTLALLHAL